MLTLVQSGLTRQIKTNLQFLGDLVHSLFNLELLAQVSQMHVTQQSGSFSCHLACPLYMSEMCTDIK